MEDVKILGRIRGLNTDILYPTDAEETIVELSGQAEQLHAPGENTYTEIGRQGRSYWINTVVEVTSVIAMPSTACGFALYNNEADGGRSYIINQVWALYTANASILPQACIVACLGQVRETALANAMSATVICKTYNGSQKYDTLARVILTATALPATTGFAGNWFPVVGQANAGVSALPGFQMVFNVDGRYIVPPGRFFGLHCVSAKVDVKCQFGVSWTEKQLNLG